MSKYGAKSPAWAPFAGPEPESAPPTYGTGCTVAKLVSCNVTPNFSEADIYADNSIGEYEKETTDVDITLETDTLIQERATAIYGATRRGNDMVYTKNDSAPLGCYGFYHSEKRNGIKCHIGHFFPKVQASRTAQTFTTRGKTVTFGTETIGMKAMYTNVGDLEIVSEAFPTEDAAFAWVASKTNLGKFYALDVSAQGVTAAKNVDKTGKCFVATGEAFTLTITGVPKALYDNGVDCIASIAAGVYKLTNVSADHQIAVIF
ncbi:MAG: hypothetical protein RR394_05315 [Oscillospiraceae bacterium]